MLSRALTIKASFFPYDSMALLGLFWKGEQSPGKQKMGAKRQRVAKEITDRTAVQ